MKLRYLFFLLLSCAFLYGQINFQDISLEQALVTAELENKSIFVDVYTTWCAPCKKLDQETFQDSTLGEYMNRHFINLKWDAESENHKSYANEFKVNVFPTLLFIDSNKKLITKQTGFKSTDELHGLTQELAKLAIDDEFKRKMTNLDQLSQVDRFELLELLLSKEHENKQQLFSDYLLNRQHDKDSLDDRKILVDNFNVENIHVFDLLVKDRQKIKAFDVASMQEQMEQFFQIKESISEIIDEAMQTENLDLLEQAFSMGSTLEANMLDGHFNGQIKSENSAQLLFFYKKTKDTTEYVKLAEELLSTHITLHSVEKFKAEDERIFRFNKKMASSLKLNDEEADTQSESYEQKYHFSCRAATRLVDISDTYFLFLSRDNPNLSKTIPWYEMATKLHPKADYFYKYAKALVIFKKNELAKSVLNEAVKLPEITSEELLLCKTLLTEIN